jgi:group I intron endonuclease
MNRSNDRVATYAIKNIVTGDAYVGSTVNWRLRKNSHMHLLRKGRHHSVWLQRAWNKYGSEAFIFVPCFNLESPEEAVAVEEQVIQEYFLNGLYNCKPKAFGFVGCDQPKTEEHKKAISGATFKSWEDPDIRKRRSMSMRGKRTIKSCPHCGLMGGGGNMKRYHFDNCKSNEIKALTK